MRVTEQARTSSLTVEAVEYLWAQTSLGEAQRTEIARTAELSERLRAACRTHPVASVRSAFAERADLSAAEISSILSSERSSQVVARLASRELGSQVLRELTAEAKVAVMDALLQGWNANGVLNEPAALGRLLSWADQREQVGRLKSKSQQQATRLVRALTRGHLDQLDELPDSRLLSYEISANPDVWFCRHRSRILQEAADGRRWRGLYTTAGRGSSEAIILSEREHGWLEDTCSALPEHEARALRRVSMSADELRAEEEQEREQRRRRDAMRDELRTLSSSVRTNGIDDASLESAISRCNTLAGEHEWEVQEVLSRLLTAQPDRGAYILSHWQSRRFPTEVLRPETLPDPRFVLDWACQGRAEGERWEYEWIQYARSIISTYRDTDIWPLIGSTIVDGVRAMPADRRMYDLAEVLDQLDETALLGAECDLLAAASERRSMPVLSGMILTRLAGVSARTGSEPTSVQALFDTLWTSNAPLGLMLDGLEAALGDKDRGLRH